MIATRSSKTDPEGRVTPTRWIGRGALAVVLVVAAILLVELAASSILLVAILAGVVILVAGAAFLWNEPGWLLPLAMYVIWFEALPPGPITSGRAVAALVILIPLTRIMTSNWRPPAVQARVWLPTAILLLWSLLSLAWSSSAGAWASGFLALFLGFAYMVLFAIFIESPDQLYRLLRPFVITGVIIGLLSALVHFGFGYRSFGFTGGPNEYAALNVESIPICVIMALRSRDWWKWFYWLAIPVFFFATLAAGSRSGLISIFVVGLFCCACRPGMRMGQRVRWLIGAIIAGAIGFVLAAILEPSRFSIAGFLSDRGGGRLDIWTAAILGFKSHWLLGYGIGGFEKQALDLIQRATGASLDVARSPDFKNTNTIPAHDLFLAVALDLGMIGVVLYFGAMLVAIKNLYDMLKTEWRDLAWIGLGVMVVIISGGPFASSLNPKLQWAFTGLPGVYFVRRRMTDRSARRSSHVNHRMVVDADS